MDSRKRSEPNLKYRCAAQVCGDMLGQVFFDDFFESSDVVPESIPLHFILNPR
jgi:hypothetical protein